MFIVQVNCIIFNSRLHSRVKMNSFKNSLLFQGTKQSTKLSVLQRNPVLCKWIKAAEVNSFCLDYMDSSLEGLERELNAEMLI